ncbi:hypothetical protein SCLCIDRAFT_1224275 [Scleroderma citrinum Foug A]|uniref:Uncharacterized protein n=1 Tax=Scleroderma citrinum Foug A TaxID=1036808 RepID=A0A0C3D6K9_9AGAM|nr:hypothetical protein SCLCIDRAFT_1224275 [Scleroderma citrinum Foug A]
MALKYAKQPWQTLYITFELITILFILLPVWSITYLFIRPRPTWSWTHAMIVAFRQRFSTLASVV